MKKILKISISIFFLLTFQQAWSQEKIMITEHVFIEIKKDSLNQRNSEVAVNFSNYSGTISVKCWSINKQNSPIFSGTYQNVSSRSSYFKKGTYVIEVEYDNKKTIKGFKVN